MNTETTKITTTDAAVIAIAEYLQNNSVPPVFSKKQAAERLQCSEKSIDNYILAGELDCFHVGSLVRFTAAHLNRFITNNERKTVK